MAGLEVVPFEDPVALPEGSALVPLEREAVGRDRAGRPRTLRSRRAVGALLPPGFVRLQFPAYEDDPSAPALAPLPYAAVAADARGELIVSATEVRGRRPGPEPSSGSPGAALREHPANALVRQLARCARENQCRAARMGIGSEELPIPVGAPNPERPRLPIDLRSGYAGSPAEHAALRPSAAEIVSIAMEHLGRGGRRVSFGRACDGEPLLAIRVVEEAVGSIRSRAPSSRIALETTGADPAALRRAIEAGVDEVTVRLASARPDTYELVHGPIAHRWSDVRSALQLAADRPIAVTLALLVMPGLSDRALEMEALTALLGELRIGRVELRDLGADPLRMLAALPKAASVGMRTFMDRIAGHLKVRELEAAPA